MNSDLTKTKTTIKVYLDDERETPRGWVRTFTPDETIRLLSPDSDFIVSDLSLDHDLGDDNGIGTGYDVLLWLEEHMYYNPKFPLPSITVHSANPAAKIRMNLAINSIVKRWQEGLDIHNQ